MIDELSKEISDLRHQNAQVTSEKQERLMENNQNNVSTKAAQMSAGRDTLLYFKLPAALKQAVVKEMRPAIQGWVIRARQPATEEDTTE